MHMTISFILDYCQEELIASIVSSVEFETKKISRKSYGCTLNDIYLPTFTHFVMYDSEF